MRKNVGFDVQFAAAERRECLRGDMCVLTICLQTSLMLDIFWAFGGERLFEVFVPDETAVFCIVKLCEYCEL
jgi:hypothetical protein